MKQWLKRIFAYTKTPSVTMIRLRLYGRFAQLAWGTNEVRGEVEIEE
jgi:hypothetical protein